MAEIPKQRRHPRHVMAYGVHVFTALGAALGFMALEAALSGNLTACFGWLAAALFVDALDGPLARRFNVQETASRYDGAILDLVVDFITYVFVPASILLRPEIMDQPWGLIAGLVITIGSALYFADTTMKTEDWWFRGFPACWNLVVFYIVAFRPPASVGMASVIILTALMFVPVIFVHPIRVSRWRPLTIGVLLVWSGAAATAIWLENLAPSLPIKAVLVVGAVYFVGLGLLRKAPGGAT